MAQIGMPINGAVYEATDANIWFYGQTNGVFSANNNLQTLASGGMAVTTSPGAAWMTAAPFKSTAYANTAPVTLTCAMADGILHRIDRVVIRWLITQSGVHPFLAIKQGVPSANPVAPSVDRTASVWELGIADIRINAGTIALTQGMITDQRLNEAVCGLVRDGVTHIPTAMLEAEFRAWFETVKDILDENTATQLYNMIVALTTVVNTKASVVVDDTFTITTNWTGLSAPFKQTVLIPGVLAGDTVDVAPLYSTDRALRLTQTEAYNLITVAADSAIDGGIIFICDEERTTVNVPVVVRVVR